MAKNPENVKSFLEALSPKLQKLWQKEREVILKYKEEEFMKMGREFNRNRPQRSIETIASFDQWSGTINNH